MRSFLRLRCPFKSLGDALADTITNETGNLSDILGKIISPIIPTDNQIDENIRKRWTFSNEVEEAMFNSPRTSVKVSLPLDLSQKITTHSK